MALARSHPSKAADRVAGLYMIEVSTGEVTLVADQPDAGITYCGSSSWLNDGKRILFDAMRPEVVQQEDELQRHGARHPSAPSGLPGQHRSLCLHRRSI